MPRVAALLAVVLAAAPAAAVIIKDPDQGRTLTPPPTYYAGAQWELQGNWRFGFTGTPISPNHFISAKHFDGTGAVGSPLQIFGTNYTAAQFWDVPGTDLRVYRVTGGTFPRWAELYDVAVDGPEVGKPAVLFGRGTDRGAPLFRPADAPTPYPQPSDGATVSLLKHDRLHGWAWGPGDAQLSWGTNEVGFVYDGAAQGYGELLALPFDRAGPDTEAALSGGDSGGTTFVLSNGRWKLAGVHFAVDGPFTDPATGGAFNAALFDMGGFTLGTGADAELIPDGRLDVPANMYSTRTGGAHLATIRAILGDVPTLAVPEPSALMFLGAGALLLRPLSRYSGRGLG